MIAAAPTMKIDTLAGVLPSVLAAALVAAAVAAQDFESLEIRTIPVAPGVHMLMGRGGNIGVSTGDDGVFLVDDQFAPLTEKIRAAIAAISEESVRFVLNTHWHGDHTGGNENLGRAGALIVAHDNVRERMSVEQFQEAFGRRVPPSPASALPVVTFSDTVTFHLNGEEIHALHVSGAHTDGDAIVHFRRADVIHAGDVYFNGMYPFIDVGSGGSIDGMIGAADRLLELSGPETKIIPGHGELSTRTQLERYREMLFVVRDRIRAALDAGRTADEIVATGPTADLDARWEKGFLKADQFVRIVCQDLSRR